MYNGLYNTMVTIPFSEFRRRASQMLTKVEQNGEVVIITRKGRPIARITKFREGIREPLWKQPFKPVRLRKGKGAAEAISADREDRL